MVQLRDVNTTDIASYLIHKMIRRCTQIDAE